MEVLLLRERPDGLDGLEVIGTGEKDETTSPSERWRGRFLRLWRELGEFGQKRGRCSGVRVSTSGCFRCLVSLRLGGAGSVDLL